MIGIGAVSRTLRVAAGPDATAYSTQRLPGPVPQPWTPPASEVVESVEIPVQRSHPHRDCHNPDCLACTYWKARVARVEDDCARLRSVLAEHEERAMRNALADRRGIPSKGWNQTVVPVDVDESTTAGEAS